MKRAETHSVRAQSDKGGTKYFDLVPKDGCPYV